MTIPSSNEHSVANASHAQIRNRGQKRDAAFRQAKQQFMSVVDNVIKSLMHKCGFSRTRATAALLNELRREVPTPTDEEVFIAMQRYGLGIEEATRALIVSSALHRSVRENGGSFVEAIDELTEKLSLTNMRAMSECADLSDSEERPRSPDRRVEAVSAIARPSSVSRISQGVAGSGRKLKAAVRNVKPKFTSKLPTKTCALPKSANRKRPIDETNQGDQKVILLERSDSVSDDVDAQVAMKCKEDDGSLPDTPVLRVASQSVVPRAKRTHRVDDGTASSQASALKRARTSEA